MTLSSDFLRRKRGRQIFIPSELLRDKGSLLLRSMTRIIPKSYVQLGHVTGSLGFAFLLSLTRPSSALTFPNSSRCLGFRLIRISPRQMEIVFELVACGIPKNSAFATNTIKIGYFLSSLIPIGSGSTNRTSRSMDIDFELAAFEDPSRTVSALI